ncbi:MAG: rod shape-determining protein MreC [Defluviitaleaceae bacterium]|nr:rod shape-determining protein MreC [Defluviitaleaceae bacterium]
MIIEFLENHRRVFLLSGIAICILAIIATISPGIGTNILSSGLSFIVTPMQRGLNSSITWVQGHFSALTNNQSLIIQNQQLQAEINRLQFENDRLAAAAAENEMLNAALNMHRRYAYLPTMGARVIAADPSDWHRSFTIDRGYSDGITHNMPIIADGSLAGLTRYVTPLSTRFVSVLDYRFVAQVIAPRTEDIGTARGDPTLMHQGLMRIDRLDATAQIIPGDEILTAPTSYLFPSGLRLGEVVSVHTNPDGLSRYAIIRPTADVSDLQVVLIITESQNQDQDLGTPE